MLIESNFTDLVDRIIVVDTNDTLRIERILLRDDRTKSQIKDIMSQQIDRDHRLKKADDIIDNNGSFNDLNNAVTQLHQQYINIKTE